MTYQVEPELHGWLSDDEFKELRKIARNKVVLELGCYMGRSTVAMAQVARHVVTIDHFKGDGYTNQPPDDLLPQFLANLEQYEVRDKVSVIAGDIRQILPMIRPREFGLIFYDAEHSGPSTRFALDWASNARAGATIAVHDYSRDYENYRDAANVVDEFAVRTGRPLRFVNVLAILEPNPVYA